VEPSNLGKRSLYVAGGAPPAGVPATPLSLSPEEEDLSGNGMREDWMLLTVTWRRAWSTFREEISPVRSTMSYFSSDGDGSCPSPMVLAAERGWGWVLLRGGPDGDLRRWGAGEWWRRGGGWLAAAA
jgi:hypothetical protein